MLQAHYYNVRWAGYLTVPTTGDYLLGGVHDDGMRARVGSDRANNTAAYQDWNTVRTSPHFLTDRPRRLNAGQPVPIEVEFRQITGPAYIQLWIQSSDGTSLPQQVVPAEWLTVQEAPVLPAGWTMSADLDWDGSGVG